MWVGLLLAKASPRPKSECPLLNISSLKRTDCFPEYRAYPLILSGLPTEQFGPVRAHSTVLFLRNLYDTASVSSVKRTSYAPLRDLRNRSISLGSCRFPAEGRQQPEKVFMCLHGVKGSIAHEVDHNDVGFDNHASTVTATGCRNGVRRRVITRRNGRCCRSGSQGHPGSGGLHLAATFEFSLQ
jgi:hypothetical protein